MTPSMTEGKGQEKKNAIEDQLDNRETVKIDETETATSPEETTSTSSELSKKKKKKREPSGTEELSKSDINDQNEKENEKDMKENGTSKNANVEGGDEKENNVASNDVSAGPVVSISKRTRPPYKYDPEKITLRFLFANKDGLTVTLECKPSDTVGEVKGQLLSVWPEGLQSCSSGDQLRLICMGKGMLIPDTRTLQDCEVPVFKTHPTPVNVAVRPKTNAIDASKAGKDGSSRGGGSSGGGNHRTTEQSGQGCGCVIS